MAGELPINGRLPLPSKSYCGSKVQLIYHSRSVTALGQIHSFLAGETVSDCGSPPSVALRGHPGTGHNCLVHYCFLICPAQMHFHIHCFSVSFMRDLFAGVHLVKYGSNSFDNRSMEVIVKQTTSVLSKSDNSLLRHDTNSVVPLCSLTF